MEVFTMESSVSDRGASESSRERKIADAEVGRASETTMDSDESEIDGYIYVRRDSESSRTGVLLYVDKSIKFEIMTIDKFERNWWTITVKISN